MEPFRFITFFMQ